MSGAFIYDAISYPHAAKGKRRRPARGQTDHFAHRSDAGADRRNHNFNTVHIDDVVLSAVTGGLSRRRHRQNRRTGCRLGLERSRRAYQPLRLGAGSGELGSKVRSGWGTSGSSRWRRVDVAGADGVGRRCLGAGSAHNLDVDFVPQGVGADLIATIEGFDRQTVDQFAVESQAKGCCCARCQPFQQIDHPGA